MDGIHVAIASEKITEWMGIPITNTVLMSWLVVAALLLLTLFLNRSFALVPSKLQALFELLLENVLEFIETTLENKVLARRFFPFLVTLFIFIFTANMLEFIPGVGSIGFTYAHAAASGGAGKTEFIPLLRSLSTDLNMPLALAIISFIVIEVSGILTFGFFRYMKRFFNFHSPIMFFVGIIELASEFIRLISFSFRLFGNIFAGEVLIAVAVFFAPYIAPIPFMAFEVFVGFIQAAIFTMLTLFFIKLAVTEATH